MEEDGHFLAPPKVEVARAMGRPAVRAGVMVVVPHFGPLQDVAGHIVGLMGVGTLGSALLVRVPAQPIQLAHRQAHQIGMAKGLVAQKTGLGRLPRRLILGCQHHGQLTLLSIRLLSLDQVLDTVQVTHQPLLHPRPRPGHHMEVLPLGSLGRQGVGRPLMLVQHPGELLWFSCRLWYSPRPAGRRRRPRLRSPPRAGPLPGGLGGGLGVPRRIRLMIVMRIRVGHRL